MVSPLGGGGGRCLEEVGGLGVVGVEGGGLGGEELVHHLLGVGQEHLPPARPGVGADESMHAMCGA